MAKNFDDVKIKYKVEARDGKPLYKFKVYTDVTEYKKISGHRFVSLVNQTSTFRNDLSTLLDFLGRQPFIDNKYMEVGRKLEQPIIDYAKEWFDMDDVVTYSFEDLKNGTDDFYFIRDLEYTNKDGERVTGEIKTFSNKQKVKWNGKVPEVNIDWWLQTRLEVEFTKDIGGKGRVFFYFVDKPMMNAVLKDRPYTFKVGNLYSSDYIIKEAPGVPEDMIEENFDYIGASSFQDLLDFSLAQRDEMLTLWEDEQGTFYYVEVPLQYDFWYNFDHVKNYIEDMSEYLKFEEEID